MTERQTGRDESSGIEDERLAVYESEREELAAGIVKAVNGQYIGKPPPLLTGWQERAVSAVLAAGWLPPAAVQERVDAMRQGDVGQYREILHCIWLYVDWKYVTKQLTTVQKDLWADAVDACGDQSEPGPKALRWWRSGFAVCEEPVYDGELECGDYADPITKRCKAHTVQDGGQHG